MYYSITTLYYKRTTTYYKVLLQYYFVLQSTTPYYKVLLQYYSVLQSTAAPPVLLRTTNVLQSTTPVLQSITPYYKVLLRTTKYYSSTTPYYKVLLQYYFVLQSTTRASKTSISCEASSTFHHKLLPKWSFRARLPQLFKEQASKTSISCEASSTFQGTSFQNDHFVRGFLNFWSNEASKTIISCEASSTFQAWSFQSLAPATQNAKMTSHLFWSAKTSISCETSFKFHTFNLKIDDFVRVFLVKSFLQSWKSMTFAKLPPVFMTRTKCCACHDICKVATFARPCHCDLRKQHLRHVTKCCACHDIAKGHLTKCCACHEKTTRLHWHTAKVLRLSRKTRKWPLTFFEAPKRAFRARLPSNSTLSTWKSTISCEFFL